MKKIISIGILFICTFFISSNFVNAFSMNYEHDVQIYYNDINIGKGWLANYITLDNGNKVTVNRVLVKNDVLNGISKIFRDKNFNGSGIKYNTAQSTGGTGYNYLSLIYYCDEKTTEGNFVELRANFTYFDYHTSVYFMKKKSKYDGATKLTSSAPTFSNKMEGGTEGKDLFYFWGDVEHNGLNYSLYSARAIADILKLNINYSNTSGNMRIDLSGGAIFNELPNLCPTSE